MEYLAIAPIAETEHLAPPGNHAGGLPHRRPGQSPTEGTNMKTEQEIKAKMDEWLNDNDERVRCMGEALRWALS